MKERHLTNVGQSMRDFYVRLDDLSIKNALYESLRVDNNEEIRFLSHQTHPIAWAKTPPSIKLQGFMNEIFKITSNVFWDTLIDPTNKLSNQEMKASPKLMVVGDGEEMWFRSCGDEVIDDLKIWLSRQTVVQLAHTIATNNSGFFGYAMAFQGLGVLFGPKFNQDYFSPNAKINMAQAGALMGQQFNTPVNSPEELYQRWTDVLQEGSSPNCFNILLAAKAFDHDKTAHRCPMVDMTKRLLRVYGQEIQDEEYHKRFVRNVSTYF